MKKANLIILALVVLTACTPVRLVGKAGVAAGRVTVGAADAVF